MKNEPLTTGQIAKYCHVTVRAVLKWVAEGKLKAYRTPGNHSRINLVDFVNFLNKYHMPIPPDLKYGVGKVKVLIVDDDKQVVSLIKKLLELDEIYDVRAAYDGFNAGRKFCEFRPELVVLDINLPGLDGYEVCKQIRNNPDSKKVKIIAISGEMDTEKGTRMLELGANDYLAKPFDNNVLKAKIEILLGTKSKNKEEEEGLDDDRR